MEELYWSGYSIALVLEIISIIIAFSQLFSIRAKNLKKVGLYYSITQGTFIEGNKPGFFSHTFGILFRLLLNPLLSWIMVIWQGYGFVSLINQKISSPEKMKEIQFKLGNSILEENEVKSLIRESANFLGKTIEFEDEEDDNTLILESSEDGWYAEIELDTKNKRVYQYSRSPDYTSEFSSTYEYKIDGNTVRQKLLEKKTNHPGEEYYDVKDGVVLESGIIERLKDNKISFIKPKEEIKKLKNNITWSENGNYKIKYFILSKHPEIISEKELQTFLRSELERIKLGFMKVEELCEKHDIKLEFNEEYKCYDYEYKNDIKEEQDIKQFREKLDSLLKKVKCEKYEIEQYQQMTEILTGYLT